MNEYENSGANGLSVRDVIFRETYVYAEADGRRATRTIDYPAPKEEIERLLADAGIPAKGRPLYAESLSSAIRELYDRMPDSSNFDELNYLAARIQALDTGQREVYAAAVEAGLHCSRLDELINLAENIVNFELTPPDKQTNSEIGEGIPTSKGLLTESGEFKQPYRFVGDIPPEQRATEFLDKLNYPDPANIIENVELTPLTLQLHAVCGDYAEDAVLNIERLEGVKSSEYLLLLTAYGAMLTEASHAYRVGTPQYNCLMDVENKPESYVFALHVTNIWTKADNGEPVRGPVIGDLVSVALRDQQWDIQLNAKEPTMVDGERHFTSEDYTAVRRHLDRVTEQHRDIGIREPMGTAELLAAVNRPFMSKAEYPQEGMIRICQSAAKEILARGDADVYRLMEHGAILQSKLAAVHIGTNSAQKSAFAIKPDGLPGLEKWAKRTAADFARQAQNRGEHKKNRDTER